MNSSTILGLLVTGWLAQATPPAAAPAPAQDKPAPIGVKLRISTSTYLSDGRVLTASANDWKLQINQPTVVYATSGRSLCDSRAAVAETPADAGFGWRLQVTPIRETASELEVRVDWRQMWAGGRQLVDGDQSRAVLTLHPGDRVIVDYMSDRLRAPLAFKRITHLGVDVGASAADAKFRMVTRQAQAGCNAVGMGLEIGLEPARSLPIIEAELWLVRPNRDGTERSDRLVVRLPLGQPAASYFFDEQALLTPMPASITVPTAKVFGDLSAFSVEGGKIHLNFNLLRSYDPGPGFVNRPGNERNTSATYRDLVATPGEVLAFQLPTIEVPTIETTLTGGPPTQALTTHRLPQLSVRLRAQIVR
jgi:hypothetical protein